MQFTIGVSLRKFLSPHLNDVFCAFSSYSFCFESCLSHLVFFPSVAVATESRGHFQRWQLQWWTYESTLREGMDCARAASILTANVDAVPILCQMVINFQYYCRANVDIDGRCAWVWYCKNSAVLIIRFAVHVSWKLPSNASGFFWIKSGSID